jgi:SAM-dependent methyltransferase
MSVIPMEREAALGLVRRYGLAQSDLVLEVGSGTGRLLAELRDHPVRVLGLEPDMRRMAEAWTSGVDTLAVHFCGGVADYVKDKYGPVKLVLSRHVKPGSDEFARLVAAASRCLAADGAIAILDSRLTAIMDVRPDSTIRRAA